MSGVYKTLSKTRSANLWVVCFFAPHLCSLLWAADPLNRPFGSSGTYTAEIGNNVITTDYRSCAATTADAAIWLQREPLAHSDVPEVLVVQGVFEKKSVQVELLNAYRCQGYLVGRLPEQQFLVGSSIEGAHSFYRNMKILKGVYALYPISSIPTEVATSWNLFLSQRLARVTFEPQRSFTGGEFFLIPVEQMALFQDMIRGKVENWKTAIYEGAPPLDSTGESDATSVSGLQVPVGTIVTPRGTFYRFNADQSVTVYPKDGTLSYRSPPLISYRNMGYSSHENILRRQGVYVSAAEDGRSLLEKALDGTERVLQDYVVNQHINPIRRTLYASELSDHLRSFSKSAELRSFAIRQAIELSLKNQDLFPDWLRWKKITLRQEAGLEAHIRDLVRFVVLRAPKTRSEEANLFFSLIDNQSLHLQTPHAQLGSLALEMDKNELIAGGILALGYDLTSGQLISIELEENGMNGLTNRRFLSSEELKSLETWLLQQVKGSAAPTVNVHIP